MVSQNRRQICQAGYFFSRLCLPGCYRYFVDLAHLPWFFKQDLKGELHGNVILRLLRAAELFSLYRHEHLIRNNGLAGVGVKEPILETIIFDLYSASANSFLEQYPSSALLTYR